MQNDQVQALKADIAEYAKFVNDDYWTLTPENEGDILHIVGIRDEIHSLYSSLSPDKKAQVAESISRLKTLDNKWQKFALAHKSDDFHLTTSGRCPEWWYNIDRIGELSDGELEHI